MSCTTSHMKRHLKDPSRDLLEFLKNLSGLHSGVIKLKPYTDYFIASYTIGPQ